MLTCGIVDIHACESRYARTSQGDSIESLWRCYATTESPVARSIAMAPSTIAVLSSSNPSSLFSYVGLAVTIFVFTSSVLCISVALYRRQRAERWDRQRRQAIISPVLSRDWKSSSLTSPRRLLLASPGEKQNHSKSDIKGSSSPHTSFDHTNSTKPLFAGRRNPKVRFGKPAPLIVGRPNSIQERITSVMSKEMIPTNIPVIALTLPSPSYDPAMWVDHQSRRSSHRSIVFTFEGE